MVLKYDELRGLKGTGMLRVLLLIWEQRYPDENPVKAIASLLSVTKSFVYNCLNGKSTLTLDQYAVIASHLKTELLTRWMNLHTEQL